MSHILNAVYSQYIVLLAVPQPQETVRARSNISLERAVNDLAAQLEEQNRLAEAHRKEIDKKLNLILETIDRLVITQQTVSAPATESVEVPLPPGTNPYLVNPPLTTELSDIITKVVGSVQSRVKSEERKPSAKLNSLRVSVIFQSSISC